MLGEGVAMAAPQDGREVGEEQDQPAADAGGGDVNRYWLWGLSVVVQSGV
jgi:hypothetical protein